MNKIIGIGGCGNNLLEFIKKQNLQDTKGNYEFISVKNDNDVTNIKIFEDDTVFAVAGFGGNTSGELTIALSKKLIADNLKVKNIVILPFTVEFTSKKVVKELKELISINQNIELFSNDDISNETNQDKTISQLMREYDKIIFDSIVKVNQRERKSFFIDVKNDNKTYRAIVNFQSKSYKITLLEPKIEMLHQSSIGNIANNRFDFKNSEDKYIEDIEEIANKILREYI